METTATCRLPVCTNTDVSEAPGSTVVAESATAWSSNCIECSRNAIWLSRSIAAVLAAGSVRWDSSCAGMLALR